MSDTFVIKGFQPEKGQLTQSDMYAKIVKEFSVFTITVKEQRITFLSVFVKMCNKYMEDYTNPDKTLDKNNQYRIDNFKGFFNFIGLLYFRGVLLFGIVYKCLEDIQKLIFHEKWTNFESSNAFDGYIFLLNIMINYYELAYKSFGTLSEDMRKTFKQHVNSVYLINNRIQSLNVSSSKLGKFQMLTFNQCDEKLNKLNELFTTNK